MSFTWIPGTWTDVAWDLSDAAYRLHVDALVYTVESRSDGVIPKSRGPRVSPAWRPRAIAELVRAGLWADDGDRYRVIGLIHHQETAAEHDAGRKVERLKKAAGRAPDEAAKRGLLDDLKTAREEWRVLREARVSLAMSPGDSTGEDPSPSPTPSPAITITSSTTTTDSHRGGRSTRGSTARRGDDAGDFHRPDIAAIVARFGKITRPQITRLDEVLSRHDVSGPRWAADIIEATPADSDPLEAVFAADRRWQADRRAAANREERAAKSQQEVDKANAHEALARLESRLQKPRNAA